jgi:hypothetical protein
MSKETAGYVVETKDGKRGRTFHNKGLVNEKVPVYLETDKQFIYSTSAILCDQNTLTIKGFID